MPGEMIQFDFLYAKYTQNKATMEHGSVEVVCETLSAGLLNALRRLSVIGSDTSKGN